MLSQLNHALFLCAKLDSDRKPAQSLHLFSLLRNLHIEPICSASFYIFYNHSI